MSTTIIPIASQEKFDSISPNRSNGQAINLELQFRAEGGGGGDGSNFGSSDSGDNLRPRSRSKRGGGDDESRGAAVVIVAAADADDGCGDDLPPEPSKTWLCAGALLVVFVANLLSVAAIHDRTPATRQNANATHPPLRDIAYDLAAAYPPLARHQFALVVAAEVTLFASCVYVLLAVLLRHAHASIVFRRHCFLLALLFGLRLLTMNATMLPVSSGTLYRCAAKERGPLAVGALAARLVDLLATLGLASADGELRYCGNYVFSGHAALLVLNCLVADEYGPRGPVNAALRAAAGGALLALVAVGFDYTISIITAYYATTRIFWIYHTMANNASLKRYDRVNRVCNEWWYPIFQFLEGNVRRVVPPNSAKF